MMLTEVQALWPFSSDASPQRKLTNEILFSKIGSTEVVIRMTPATHRSRSQIEAELEYISALHCSGFKVPVVILSKNGQHIETIQRKTMDNWQSYHIVVFEKIHGHLAKTLKFWTRDHMSAFGGYLARLHLFSEAHPELNRLDRPDWRNERLFVSAQARFTTYKKEKKKLWSRCIRDLETLQQNRTNFGLVHADLHVGNLLLSDSGLYAIDFDDCCFHFFAYDMISPLWTLFRNLRLRGINISWSELWLPYCQGYSAARELPDRIQEMLESLFLYRTLLIDSWLRDGLDKGVFAGELAQWCTDGLQWNREILERRTRFT